MPKALQAKHARAKFARTELSGAGPAQPATSARRALAEAVRDLAEAARLCRLARLPVARLDSEIAAERPVAEALQAVEGEEAQAMARWARTGQGPAPEPRIEERRAAADRLSQARMRAEAAAGALPAARDEAEAALGRLEAARDRIGPAAERVLREEGARLAAEYWRRFTGLERLRRELAALDRVLIADFPIIHAPTGREMVEWLSPDKLAAPDAMRAVDRACAQLGSVEDFIRDWRAKAADLMGGAGAVA